MTWRIDDVLVFDGGWKAMMAKQATRLRRNMQGMIFYHPLPKHSQQLPNTPAMFSRLLL